MRYHVVGGNGTKQRLDKLVSKKLSGYVFI